MSGTVVFQSNTPATPGPGIVVAQDDVSGTAWQYVKLDVGPAGTSRPVSYASGTGVPVQGVGTFQMLGSIQSLGTGQILGTTQPLAGSVHLASRLPGTVDIGTIAGTVQMLGTFQPVGTFPIGTIAGTVSIGTIARLAGGTIDAIDSTVITKEVRSSAPITTSVGGTIGNVILLAANPARLGAAFYLDGGSALFLKLGSLAGTLSYTVQLTQNAAYYETPFQYTGTISGIWQFAGGSVRITEIG